MGIQCSSKVAKSQETKLRGKTIICNQKSSMHIYWGQEDLGEGKIPEGGKESTMHEKYLHL